MDFNNRTLKVFLAGLQGGSIGTFVAMAIHPHFWWVGLIVGVIVGYLAYDWQEVNTVIGNLAYQSSKSFAIKFNPNWNKTRKFSSGILYGICYFVAMALMICPILPVVYNETIKTTNSFLISIFVLFPCILILGGPALIMGYFLAGIILCFGRGNKSKYLHWVPNIFEDEEVCFDNYMELKPIEQLKVLIVIMLTPLVSIVGYVLGILLIACLVIIAVINVMILVWKYIKMLHCDERLVSGLYCLLGVAAGYKTNHGIIGVVVGGLVAGILAVGTYRLFLFLATKTTQKTC